MELIFRMKGKRKQPSIHRQDKAEAQKKSEKEERAYQCQDRPTFW